MSVLAVENLRRLLKSTKDAKEAKRLFKHIDADGSGGIDIEELSDLMIAMSSKMETLELEEVGGRVHNIEMTSRVSW